MCILQGQQIQARDSNRSRLALHYFASTSQLVQRLPVFFQGVGTTVELALCTAIFGTLLGIVVALLRMSRVKLLKVLAGAYIEFLRGTPLLVQVLIVFYGLPQMGVKLPRMTAGTVALVINSAAYMAEIRRVFRSVVLLLV